MSTVNRSNTCSERLNRVDYPMELGMSYPTLDL